MDIDKRIQEFNLDLEAILLENIKTNYKKGIAYLCFGEIKELKLMWHKRDYIGSETIVSAFEMLTKSEELSKYIDGFAVGNDSMRNNLMRRGMFWNFKQNYQLFDNSYEFGPQPCPYTILDEKSKNRILAVLTHKAEVGSFIFSAMKYICLYKSLNRRKIFLSDERYFHSFSETSDFMEEAVQALNEILSEQRIYSKIIPSRNRWFHKKPMLKPKLDIEIIWPDLKT